MKQIQHVILYNGDCRAKSITISGIRLKSINSYFLVIGTVGAVWTYLTIHELFQVKRYGSIVLRSSMISVSEIVVGGVLKIIGQCCS